MENVESVVARQPFLHGLKPYHFQTLSKCASFADFEPNVIIFREGTEAGHFYLVHDGRVALDTLVPGQGLRTVETIGPGDALGWSWLVPPYVSMFGAVTVQPTEAFHFDARLVRALCQADPQLGYELTRRFLGVASDRLRASRARLLDRYVPARPWP